MGGLGAPRVVGYLATAFCVAAVLGDREGWWSVRAGWGQGVLIAAVLVAVGGLAFARRRKPGSPRA